MATQNKIFRVPPCKAPVRLDTFLVTLNPHVPKRQLRLALHGSVRVDGRYAKKGTLLLGGEEILVPELLLRSFVIPNQNLRVPILYEDDHIIVIDKPPSIPCCPIHPSETETIANFLVAHEPGCSSVGRETEAGLVHRLDTETSGLLLAAKKTNVFRKLRQQFSSGQVIKEYIALCLGQIQSNQAIVLPLAHSPADRRKMVVFQPDSRKVRKHWRARTQVQILQVYRTHTLVSLKLKTGVTHQIRVHLTSIGHPLEGESLYADPTSQTAALGLKRHFLHAARLTLIHPVSGDLLQLESPLPDDLTRALAELTQS
jgi:23S rRNA pseudouridine1911/1915/1917 synthase